MTSSGSGNGLIKVGTGAFTLEGANTYDGGTTISAGKLLVKNTTGSGVGTGDLVIGGTSTAGTLGGTGTLGLTANATNVTFGASGGTIAPGVSPGILTVNGGVDFTTVGTATFAVELNGLTVGTDYDQLVVKTATGGTNLIDLDNATLQVALGFTPSVGNQFTIIDNQITSGGLSGIFNGLSNNGTFAVGLTTFRINYDAGTNNDVVLTVTQVVPEPSTFAMLLFGSAFLWMVRRKRG
jgi:autotransporter-associated beta strand protein